MLPNLFDLLMKLNEYIYVYYIYWLCTLFILTKILFGIWSLIEERILPWFIKEDYKKYGEWAVITGSTSGIGKEFALQLASKGINICLISRNEEKLKKTAKEIEASYNVRTRYIVADFSDSNIYTHIKENLAEMDIGILVNNVGIITKIEPFINQSEQLIKQIHCVNMLSGTMMTNTVLPCMIRKQRGLIINISSIISDLTVPYFSLYNATKTYVTKLGLCLSHELKKYNIDVITFNAGILNTNFLDPFSHIVRRRILLVPFFIQETQQFVKNALLTARSGCRKAYGSIWVNVYLTLNEFIPTWFQSGIMLLTDKLCRINWKKIWWYE